jgi:hypothetical protein
MKVALSVLVTVLLFISLIYQFDSLSRISFPRQNETTPVTIIESTSIQGWNEQCRSREWQLWRAVIHEKLSIEPPQERHLIEALQINIPALPDSHTEADVLRRDEAIADVLLSYKGVKKILAERFGIREEFLGTGMSKPLGLTPYSSVSVHEYLIKNLPETSDHVWTWSLTPLGSNFSKSVQEIICGESERIDPKKKDKYAEEMKEILIRIKNKDHPLPPMIRFARFDKDNYKGTVGFPGTLSRPKAIRVFTSNLSEVWDLTLQQATEKSGYTYKGPGDTLFIWVFVPYHTDEFVPATWRQVLVHLRDWLENGDQ